MADDRGEKYAVPDTVIRRVVMRPEWRWAMKIRAPDSQEPIQADWAGISYVRFHDPRRSTPTESYHLEFYLFDGTVVATDQFDTLQRALAWGQEIAGIPPAAWEECAIVVTDEEGRVPWPQGP